jgi:hypothetical protein
MYLSIHRLGYRFGDILYYSDARQSRGKGRCVLKVSNEVTNPGLPATPMNDNGNWTPFRGLWQSQIAKLKRVTTVLDSIIGGG